MVTARPKTAQLAAAPEDDGLFGPGSMTWEIFTATTAGLAGTPAVLLQMLMPRVMWMIEQSSITTAGPEANAKRGQLTLEYENTIIYGDSAAAEQAGATLRNIHHHRRAVDPQTGEEYPADQPDLLLWVHMTIVWSMLRAYQRWGRALSQAEADRFVEEQRIAARLVGVDPADAPGTVAEMDAYMAAMRPRLAVTSGAADLLTRSVPRWPSAGLAGVLGWMAGRIAVELLTPEQRRLFGVRWSRLDSLLANSMARLIVKLGTPKLPLAKQLPQLRADAMANAFGGKGKRLKKARAAA